MPLPRLMGGQLESRRQETVLIAGDVAFQKSHNVASGGHRNLPVRSAFGLSAAAQFATQFPQG